MWWFDEKEDKTNDRSHQDNIRYSHIDNEEWDNGSYQYCRFCGKMTRFRWDRCMNPGCHNN